jgi:hypothetical protein
MARSTACAIAALAIGIALAAEARAEKAPAPEPVAGATTPTAEEVTTARWLTYGTTGFGVALGVGLAFAGSGLGASNLGLFIAGAAFAGAAFVAGPSAGWYSLGHPLRASLTLVGRLLLLGGAAAMSGYGASEYLFEGGAGAVLLAGAFVCGVGALTLMFIDFDIPGAPDPTAPAKGPAIEVAPTAWVGPNAAGLAAAGAF